MHAPRRSVVLSVLKRDDCPPSPLSSFNITAGFGGNNASVTYKHRASQIGFGRNSASPLPTLGGLFLLWQGGDKRMEQLLPNDLFLLSSFIICCRTMGN